MIRLRPYYLFTILRQLDAGEEPVDTNSLPEITRRLTACRFREQIQLVQTFCDACRGCIKMVPDPRGCLWGDGYRCASADTPQRLNQVEDQMRSILYDLQMRFGETMRADELILRAVERRPFHYFHIPEWQAAYERGVLRLREVTGLKPRISGGLFAQRRHYEPDSAGTA
jgi:hypothetical protein